MVSALYGPWGVVGVNLVYRTAGASTGVGPDAVGAIDGREGYVQLKTKPKVFSHSNIPYDS